MQLVGSFSKKVLIITVDFSKFDPLKDLHLCPALCNTMLCLRWKMYHYCHHFWQKKKISTNLTTLKCYSYEIACYELKDRLHSMVHLTPKTLSCHKFQLTSKMPGNFMKFKSLYQQFHISKSYRWVEWHMSTLLRQNLSIQVTFWL